MAADSAPLQGVFTALVTPFRDGHVDEKAFAHLLEEQVAADVDGVIPVGTTGESPTLSMEEHLRVIELAIRVVNRRTKVFAGTGSNNTSEAIYLTQHSEKLGADGFLVVSPYYNKPSQAGLFAHYAALAKVTSRPIIAYSVPGRTGSEIGVETMASLTRTHANIVAIKEAGGSIERFSQLRQVLPDHVAILSGDDSMTLPAMALGASGVVSVASNLVPRVLVTLVGSCRQGRFGEAEELHRTYYPLFRDLFIESNPVPVKTALALQGWMSDEVRLPLVALQPASRIRLEGTLKQYGLHEKR
jgi:4-hydroxy-tetrahydrodipicolinate synthase